MAPRKRIVMYMAQLTGERYEVCSAQYDALMAAIDHELRQGNRVRIPYVGSFQIKDAPRKLSRHPYDRGELYITPPRRHIRFRFNCKFTQYIRNLTDEWVPKI